MNAEDVTPRTFVFGAKAAPGYRMAKQTIAPDQRGRARPSTPTRAVEGRLTVAFPANYNVTLAEKLIPAADLSEQISLAGKEASGTGNMKFALNGALTIGTDDGANVEIRELVGDDNFFLFGLLEPEVADARTTAGYHPTSLLRVEPRRCGSALDLIASGRVLRRRPGRRSSPIVSNLLYEDRFLALADYQAYIDAQDRVDERLRRHRGAGPRSAILNVARSRLLLLRPLDARLHRPDLAHAPAWRPRRG